MWMVMMPSAIVHIKLSASDQWETYAPYPKDMEKFQKAAEEFEWSPNFLHPIFCNMFRDRDEFLAWTSTFAKQGMTMVKNAIRRGDGDREKTSWLLKSYLKYIGERSFDNFQMQAILSTVEKCCAEAPFGEINCVSSGFGETCGSLCMLEACVAYLEYADKRKYLIDVRKVEESKITFPSNATKTELSKRVPNWLVIIKNAETEKRLKSPCRLTREQMRRELEACNLKWSEEKNCLVHSIGLQTELNANDTEHLNCGTYGLLALVRPERNVSKKPNIDGSKYHPVRCPPKCGVSSDLPLMEPLIRTYREIGKVAYQALLKDEGYPSACEGDLNGLLIMDLLMALTKKAVYLGNLHIHTEEIFDINHSVPGLKMLGYDKPDLPYQLRYRIQQGWGTKLQIDFSKIEEKVVTIAQMNPWSNQILAVRGEVIGVDGMDEIYCNPGALISFFDAKGYFKKQDTYGHHGVMVYGDYTQDLERLAGMLGMEIEVYHA